MNQNELLKQQTRRHFFNRCGIGVGAMALSSLMRNEAEADAELRSAIRNPLAPKPPHFPAKAKSIIYLFMAGGPSQLEMWDHKPKLRNSTASRSRKATSQANASPS